MNKQTQEALEMAYKAEETGNLQDLVDAVNALIDAVNALIEALEQPAQDYVLICKRCGDDLGIEYVPDEQPAQEPVAWMYENHNIKKYQEHRDASLVLQYGYQETPLYTRPHQWQGLTDDEIEAIDDVTLGDYYSKKDAMDFYRAIEARLKEKNHG